MGIDPNVLKGALEAASQQALVKLRDAAANPDKEAGHQQADRALCDLLNELGYYEVVKAFREMEKWYA